MHSHRLTIALLSTLCIALAIFAASEFTDSETSTLRQIAPGASASKVEPAVTNSKSFSLPGLRSFSNITERPLFSPDRRPAVRSVDATGAWSSFLLTGIIIAPQSREALVVHGKPPTSAHLVEGQTVDGWTLTAIYPDHVVFSDQLSEHELKLIDKGAPPPAQRPTSPVPRRPNP
jgi:type II secretory pathway component PulC